MKAIALVAILGLGLGAVALGSEKPATDGLVAVRYQEGMVHGFLVLRTASGKLLTHGDLLQLPDGEHIESRMVFRFPDGSVYDERVTFTQQRVFRMLNYHLVQRGPSFTEDSDMRLDRATGKYRVVTTEHRGGKEEVLQGDIDLPEDVYNGMVITIAKNLPAGAAATVHLVAFTPKPRVIALELEPAGDDRVALGAAIKPAAHWVLKPKLGPIIGLVARLAGKLPPDNHAWIVTEDVPVFVRFEGPLSMGGPVWRIELASPEWKASDSAATHP